MTKLILLFYLISISHVLIEAQESTAEPISNAQRIFEFINYGPIGLLTGILPSTINSLNLTNQCQLSLNHLIKGLHNGELWSNLMIASSGKGLNDLLEGTYLNLGNYDQCLSIESSKINETKSNVTNNVFYGQYCLLDILPQQSLLTSHNDSMNDSLRESDFLNATFNVSQRIDTLFRFPEQLHSKVGLCLPSICTENDATVLVNTVLEEYLWKLYRPIRCQVKRTFKQTLTESNIATKISLFILASILLSILTCTVLHLVLIEHDGFLDNLIKCFSLKENMSKLLSPKTKTSVILNAVQSFVILFCVISHSYLYFIWLDAYVVYDKVYNYLFNVKNIFYQPFVNIFDINTGLLFLVPSTFACIRLFSNEINISRCLKEIGSHFIRHLLIMIVLISIQIALPIFVSESGPLADQFFRRDAYLCHQSWYKNILFINNFNEFDKQCVVHSWTIVTEFQLFIILTILVLLYTKLPALAKALNIILILSSIISIWIIVFHNFLPPQLLVMPLNINRLKTRAKLIHFSPYVHLLEYFLPLFVFNLIFNKTIKRFHATTRRTFLYLLVLAFLIIQFYSFPFSSLDFEGTPVLNAFVIITCKLTVPVFFVFIIYNYYTFNLDDSLKEIGLNLFSLNLFSSANCTKNLSRKIDELKQGHEKNDELEMVMNKRAKHEENDKLMNDKNDRNSRLINEIKANDKLSIDKLIIEMQDKCVRDDLLKIKLNELLLNESSCFLPRSIETANLKNDKHQTNVKNNRKLVEGHSFKSMFTIYTQLARSIYCSHHFYLSFDLYTVREPLSTDIYSIVARLIYNLFYIHLIAVIFYLFVELPLYSFAKLIYKKILNLLSS